MVNRSYSSKPFSPCHGITYYEKAEDCSTNVHKKVFFSPSMNKQQQYSNKLKSENELEQISYSISAPGKV